MKKRNDLLPNLYRSLPSITCFIVVAGFLIVMFVLLGTVINRLSYDPINTVIESLSQTTDIPAASISAITGTASNAITSTTLIVTVIGIFMTGVSIFAALILYVANIKISHLDSMIKEFDSRINIETYMRHLSSGIRYSSNGLYNYALVEFEKVLATEDEACRMSANYYMGIVHSDRFSENCNPTDFEKAKNHFFKALEYEPDIDQIITNDSYASLGCLYGTWAQNNFDSVLRDGYLEESEKYLMCALKSFNLAIHYKNLAITFALKKDVDKAINCIENAIQRDADEKGLADKKLWHSNANSLLEKLFIKKEIELIKDVLHQINAHFLSNGFTDNMVNWSEEQQ